MEELKKFATSYAVRIAVDDGKELVGSGVLYVTGKVAFVWTVAHVVDSIIPEGKTERKIRLSFCAPFEEDSHHYKVLELQARKADGASVLSEESALIYIDSNYNTDDHIHDVAIIQIPFQSYMYNYIPLIDVKLNVGDKAVGVGFPGSMNKEWRKDSENELAGRKCFTADINNASTVEGFNIEVKGTQFEDDVTRESVMKGFSGSGIYSSNAMSKGIVGLVSKPVGKKSAGNMVSCTKIGWYFELMKNLNLIEEIPDSFESYADLILEDIGNSIISEKREYIRNVLRNRIIRELKQLSFDEKFENLLVCQGRRHVCGTYWSGQLKRIMIFFFLDIPKNKYGDNRVEKYKISLVDVVDIDFLCSEDGMEKIVHNIKSDENANKKNTIFICNSINHGLRTNCLDKKACARIINVNKAGNRSDKKKRFNLIHGDNKEENMALLGIDRLIQKVIDGAPNEKEVKKKVKGEIKEVW